jgi:hypothetical protein
MYVGLDSTPPTKRYKADGMMRGSNYIVCCLRYPEPEEATLSDVSEVGHAACLPLYEQRYKAEAEMWSQGVREQGCTDGVFSATTRFFIRRHVSARAVSSSCRGWHLCHLTRRSTSRRMSLSSRHWFALLWRPVDLLTGGYWCHTLRCACSTLRFSICRLRLVSLSPLDAWPATNAKSLVTRAAIGNSSPIQRDVE